MPAEFPSGPKICSDPSPLGFGARFCVYGRADAAVNDGDTSIPNGSATGLDASAQRLGLYV
jgi:hypothetical protein